MSLDVSPKQFKHWIDEAGKLIASHYQEHSESKVFAGKGPDEVQELLNESLPNDPQDMDSLLDEVGDKILSTITNSAGPRYFGYITGGGNQAAVLAEMIKASLNQNNLKWHSSPVSTELERLVMRWVAEFIGYPTSSAGVLLSGGSVANFNCLAVARKIKAPVDISDEGIYGSQPMTVYVSEEGHSSFDKAMDMLGLGKKYLRKIPVDDEFRIDVDQLEEQIRKDKNAGFHPICAIAVAGTTNTGAVDNLETVAEICQRYDLWYHIDAAYGGPAAKVEGVSPIFSGIEKADSVVVNPHKWLYVPFEAGGALVKNPDHLRQTFSTIPDYLKSDEQNGERTDLMEYNLPLTKEFKALKVWMTVKAYGATRLRNEINSDISKATFLAELIESDEELELMAPVPLSIVCFRYNPGGMDGVELNTLNDQIIQAIEEDGRIFLTGTKINGKTALRVCFINPRTNKDDIQLLKKVVLEIGKKLGK
ncbi:pyridoxal phosphate-dependent decarboxylase family protein [Fodinibius sp. SL11]|uniref:pyridoxal phosphate-dependent decarboxylase family protein n=1 Tax=Fodinibius sp. SL11 TaxID=3425690 RepID=UPI003F885217